MARAIQIGKDHARFRRLMKRVVMNLVESGFSDDPRVKMYESQEAFAGEWPHETERKVMLDSLENDLRAAHSAIRNIKRNAPDFLSLVFEPRGDKSNQKHR